MSDNRVPDRYDALLPASLIASMASMPRRWKDAMHLPPPKSAEDYFTLEGPDGTPAEHLGAAIAQLRLINDAIRTTSYNVPESVGPDVQSAVADQGSGPWPSSAHGGLSDLVEQFEAIGERLGALSASDWNKSASAPSGNLTVLAIAQGASRVAANRLAIFERTLQALAD